jgi:putative oxidoreductase
MRDLSLLVGRLTLGGYVAAHGVQKLFGAFGGHGVDQTGQMFEMTGLRPGKQLAIAAGASETAGGLFTALGSAWPVGPVATASTMAVAATTAHRGKGFLAATGGPELPLTNFAFALVLATGSAGRYSLDHLLGGRLHPTLVRLLMVSSAVAAGAIAIRAVSEQNAAQQAEQEAADAAEGGSSAWQAPEPARA